jgi:hypothetical protein
MTTVHAINQISTSNSVELLFLRITLQMWVLNLCNKLPNKKRNQKSYRHLKESWNIFYWNIFFILWISICLTIFLSFGYYYTCVMLALMSKNILIFKLMNLWLVACYFIYIYIFVFNAMYCKVDFTFLWCMVYKLILDEMYAICKQLNVSDVTCVTGWTINKSNKTTSYMASSL